MLIQLLYSQALSQITPVPSSMLGASGLPWEGRPHIPCGLCHSCSGLCSPGLLTNTTLHIFYFSETFSSSLLGFLSFLLSPLLSFQGDFSSGRRLTLMPVHCSEPGSPDCPSPPQPLQHLTPRCPSCLVRQALLTRVCHHEILLPLSPASSLVLSYLYCPHSLLPSVPLPSISITEHHFSV